MNCEDREPHFGKIQFEDPSYEAFYLGIGWFTLGSIFSFRDGTLMAALRSRRPTENLAVLHRLRTSTSALHKRVDSSMDRLLRSGEGGYGRFLSAIATALLPLERELTETNVSAILPDWSQRSRSAALLSDLAELSVRVPALRSLSGNELLCHEAYQYGILYVLEGSRLGARVILRSLKNSANPTHYLSHGDGSRFWETFLGQLARSRASQENEEMVIAGAIAAFQLFLPEGNQPMESRNAWKRRTFTS